MQYRYSALDTFRQCPRKYKYQYLDGVDAGLDMLYLVGGTMFHAGMEAFYKSGADRGKATREAWADWLAKKGVKRPWNVLADYHEFWRCRRTLLEPFRSGEIVNDKGEKYKKPTATNAFKAIRAKSNYNGLKQAADRHVIKGLYLREQDNVAETYADTMDWLEDYQHPIEYGRSIDSERKFFITDPWGHTHEGSIDQVFEMADDPTEYAIHDFKTSKTPKTQVEYDPQLSMYAFAGHQLFGRWPKRVSLHFVRDGLIVSAEVDPDRVMEVYADWVQPLVRGVELAREHDVWPKHNPESFGSPCGLCPYFLAGKCNKQYLEVQDAHV